MLARILASAPMMPTPANITNTAVMRPLSVTGYLSPYPTVVIVTNELASIFAIGNDAVFLDADTKTMLATGSPHELRKAGPPAVRRFLSRGVDQPLETVR